jgi:hypothetical protein
MSKNKHSKLKKGLRKSLRKPLRVKVKTAAVITAPENFRNVSVATFFVDGVVENTDATYNDDEFDKSDDDDVDNDEKDSDYVDEPDDNDASSADVPDNSPDNDPLFRIIIGQLKAERLEMHLENELAHRTAATVNTIINRYAKFFLWCFYQSEIPGSNINVLKILQDIVLKRFQILTKYYTHLRETLLFQPSTVYNLNEEILILLNWFAVFRVSRDDRYSVQPADLYAVNLVVKAMRKFYSKERRRLACKSTKNTVEGLMAANKWPRGGLKELDDAAESQMQWARDVCANPSILNDPTVYSYFMQLLCATFYTGTPLL